ncbi:phosphopantothenoylcysteine decarboxylase [Echinicola pacifica]|uniref:Coenzyme A biosynthesis bifunctional protein CoaBC n=1 Tax=Echinicola pacifica TaxID=346377 RepID=A0A918UR29_9BACT|nr:bifunctional phosphopantothenoylcysteine decarboxylase/phosphopantothenate--cysteine ligase CoaBC [Echinicola pacifica]GGZ28443.1 phosphopantothenoylcysteine decarboxylase [Echinicola pacifica]
MPLQGKKIVVAVTGSIAAYKAAHLTRLLVKEGAEVQIIMSTSALDFITPLTLSTLSKRPVYHRFHHSETGEWTNHVELGLWADLFLIAPISASTLAKIATGNSDNLLTATYLSARCPVMVAPAMDLDMYQHPSVQQNLRTIEGYGNIILAAESGELASGLSGQGRMMEPEHIVQHLKSYFQDTDIKKSFSGKTALVTAGPTQEAIDPVRYIGNHSSGKMGLAIALELAEKGAKVELILGPVSLALPTHPNIHITKVISAHQMYEAAAKLHQNTDLSVFAAAVADYAPAHPAKDKIKKAAEDFSISLKKNIDIAAKLGEVKKSHQVHIGFALETSNENQNALSKLERKNFDLVILNSMNDQGAGFKHDTNKVTIFHKDGKIHRTELMSKTDIAKEIVKSIEKIFSTEGQ